jgi:alpha-beta hydrolase superfamily lysophospholipase
MRTEEKSTHRIGDDTFTLHAWASPVPTRTVLVVHHGLGEHGGRYASAARHLETLPAHLWSYDLRGHGESSGKRGDAAGLDQLAGDFEALLPVILERSGAERAIVWGHSLGGACVARYLTTKRVHPAIAAVLLSAPAVYVPKTLSIRVKIAAARALVRWNPSLTMANEIPVTGISSDPAEVERYRTDPLVHDRLSVQLGLSILDDAPRIVDAAGAVKVPTMLWHGLDDPIVDVRGTRALFEALGTEDKLLVELPGYRHESHHERPEMAAALFARMRGWLEPRLAVGVGEGAA